MRDVKIHSDEVRPIEEKSLKPTYTGDGARVGFFQAIGRGLGRGNRHGRASRSEFWYFWLFGCILNLVSIVIFTVIYDLNNVDRFVGTVISGLTMLVFIRRLHDVNRSGWWILIAPTIIGLIPLFIWSIRKGEPHRNRFDIPSKSDRPALGQTSAIRPPASKTTIEQVEQLYRLRMEGAITEEEYEALKRKVV